MMWVPLVAEYLPLVAGFFARNQYRLSDYALPSLVSWNSSGGRISFKITDGILLLLVKGEEFGGDSLLLPLGLETVNALALRDIAVKHGVCRFCSVPEDLVGADFEEFFERSEDEKNANYIYRSRDLAMLRGNDFMAKRNHINWFLRKYTQQRVATAPIAVDDVDECLLCLERWQEEKIAPGRCVGPFFNEECRATAAALRSLDHFDWVSLLVRVDGDVCGFAIGSRVNRNTVALNFEKALSCYRGLYQFMDREFARAVSNTYEYINKEGDMGIANLRASKESYRPLEKLRWFSLSLREEWRNAQH